VDVSLHEDFPLEMFTYGRECVHGEGRWDAVTTKCRGIIYRTDTEEIIARPFEKFFNLRTMGMPSTDPETWCGNDGECGEESFYLTQPEVWEKMDGFLATLYEWEGKQYIASKGSFDSPHAKWATAWLNSTAYEWLEGYTPVFEGISPNFRIVVNYENYEGLVLLALINNETGEEAPAPILESYAYRNGLKTPKRFYMSWEDAAEASNDETKNFEGYVLVWRRPGTAPFRLKVKYADYLRLHRMISAVSPKAIYNCLASGKRDDLVEWTVESTPWFNKYVTKWVRALSLRHEEYMSQALAAYTEIREVNRIKVGQLPYENMGAERKAYALEFARYPEIKGILFAMLDGKDSAAIAWKLVKPLIHNSHPMIDLNRL
jgi:RNA ligase